MVSFSGSMTNCMGSNFYGNQRVRHMTEKNLIFSLKNLRSTHTPRNANFINLSINQ